jgi:hypothetical protein
VSFDIQSVLLESGPDRVQIFCAFYQKQGARVSVVG